MKPTNYDSQGCDPMSSNCVIWQGPDIECINLCKGDSVTTVVNNLATELCDLLASIEATTFDISCFNLQECAPEDFKGLIQLLIDRICALEGIEPGTGSGSTGCPDNCIVQVCEDFQQTGPNGLITELPIDQYVFLIGSRVCSLVLQINTANASIADHETRITDNDGRITVLEGAGITLPQVSIACILSGGTFDMDTVLEELGVQFCALQDETGTPANIIAALSAALLLVPNDAPLLGGSGEMSTIPEWEPSPANIAESFENAWITIKDLRDAVQYIQANCCDTSCSSINLSMNLTLISPSVLRIDYVGSIPSAFVDNDTPDSFGNPYSTMTLQNPGGSLQTELSQTVAADFNNPSTIKEITLNPAVINSTQDISVSLSLRLKDGTLLTTCDSTIQGIALGTNACPDVIIVPNYFEMSYSFSWAGVQTTFDVELYELAAPTVVIASNQIVSSNGGNGTFTNLTENTAYFIRLKINTIACADENVTTLLYPNNPPVLLGSPVATYATPEGDTLGNTIDAWADTYETYYGPITP